MDASEKIKTIIVFFLGMESRKLGWRFMTFRDIEYGTEISKKESFPICELLKREGLIDYEFMPFDNPEIKNNIYNKYNDNIQDPTGSMSFFAFPKDDDDMPPRRINAFETARLEEIVASDTELQGLARKLQPEVQYDVKTSCLISGEKSMKINSPSYRAICTKIFACPPGTIFSEDDIGFVLEETIGSIEGALGERPEYHRVYNDLNQINLKIKALTGIPRLIKFKGGQIWTD